MAAACGPEPAPGRPDAPPFRPDGRAAWTASRVAGSPDPPLPYRARRAFPKLSFKQPVHMAGEPGTGRLLVVELEGKVHAFANDPAAEKTDLWLESKGTWFYSVAFHPRYAENRQVFVFTNGPAGQRTGKKNRILRYEVRDGRPDARTERLVIEWESNGHDGGEMAFGPDGMFYVSSGDGTTDSDTNLTGQDLRDLNSGILRIDVERPDAGRGYSVPKDNPFLAIEGARPELWAYGFRNPWRMTFDPRTGDLWVGDIGQDLWEMVEVVRKGDNYGWSVYEGGHPFQLPRTRGPTPVTKPAIVHPHSEARSITGGFVYVGPKFRELDGAYVYGDLSTGRVWAARYRDGRVVDHQEIADTPHSILSFGTDPAGEIYLVDYYAGQLHRLEASPPEAPRAPFPRTLSESGVFEEVRGHRLHPALLPYSVNSPLWSDGALKDRAIGLPGDARIDFTEEGAWKFPEGTVLVKTFSLETDRGARPIETRFLTLQQNEWVGYSYAWDEAATDGVLVGKEGMHREFRVRDPKAPGGLRRQTWYYPSRADCMVCHSRAAAFVLGPQTPQMNRDHDYGGGAVRNQLLALEALGVFRVKLLDHVRVAEAPWHRVAELRARAKVKPSKPRPKDLSYDPMLLGVSSFDPVQTAVQVGWTLLRQVVTRALEREPRYTARMPKRPPEYKRLADPYDPGAGLPARVRSYLQANCAHCHVEAGGGNSAMDLHVNTRADQMRIVDVPPQHDAFGIRDARIVAPGAPERSILYHRLSRRGPGQMPPLASSVADEAALELVRAWIAALSKSE
jgi:glucose/arabinose dehydrogenase